MLSYRHAYHAGNFADVLKHLVLVESIRYLGKKDGAFDYIDTHAGAGMYHLGSAYGQKLQEHAHGIAKLYNLDWPELQDYLFCIRACNPAAKLSRYPGSPMLALSLLRPGDRAWLYELHPTDYPLLCKTAGKRKKTKIFQEDGCKALPGLLPPASRRALVLIDPPYELKSDFTTVVSALAQAHRRFATGVYLLWYPVVERRQIDRLERDLRATAIPDIVRFELGPSADNANRGMTSSGMIVINPPWGLYSKMAELLPRMASVLGYAGGGVYRCDVLAGE